MLFGIFNSYYNYPRNLLTFIINKLSTMRILEILMMT